MADSLLITGPPASGKSRAALESFLARPGSVLIVPTATMAEHVRHQLARSAVAVRPNRVRTLANFMEARAGSAASPALLDRAIRETMDELRPMRFREVAQYPGLRHTLASLLEEAPESALPPDLAHILQRVKQSLARRGSAMRIERLSAAARNTAPLPERLVFDGFFSFAPAELALLEALATRSELIVTLPAWHGSEGVRKHLLAAGFIEHRCSGRRRRAPVRLFSAPTLEQETEEIARRILAEAGRSRPFREIGIVLRAREPYGPALETVFARFGIPARFYFADSLATHPAIQFFFRIVEASLRDWDQAGLLSALRMPVSGFGATKEGDAFDFALRQKLPGRGLLENVPPEFHDLAWMRERFDPAQWAARLRTLAKLLPNPIDVCQIEIARSLSAALSTFDKVLVETAAALVDRSAMPLQEFWTYMENALRLEPLRHADGRRNVVQVLDVFEARQWELPVVFVCGMIERHFPQYHREDPLLGDAARASAGMKTSAELQNDEDFLFEIATSRATQETILSYARFDERGDETLRSFFVEGLTCEPSGPRIRPIPRDPAGFLFLAPIRGDASLARLSDLHRKLAATSIETFLQCPFQFFAAKTLRLTPRPPAPRDRLDVRLQGSILHRALAEFSRAPLLGPAILDEVFFEECARANIPLTYRTEAIRLELLRNFLAFTTDRQIVLNWATRVEEKFSFALNPVLTITGRMDRLDVGPRDEALVIDYKYSAAGKIRERVEDNDGGSLVQGGLYLAAAQRALGLQPAGMLYCGLRKEIAWGGWHIAIAGLERIGESRTREALQDLIDTASGTAARVFESITSGEIAARPADEKKCVWCDFRDACRVESIAIARIAGAQ